MLFNLSFNSIMWIIIGVVLIGIGAWVAKTMRMYAFAVGFASLGSGCIFCGLTNGFTLHTPAGILMRKIGVLGLLVGIPLTGYYMLMFVR